MATLVAAVVVVLAADILRNRCIFSPPLHFPRRTAGFSTWVLDGCLGESAPTAFCLYADVYMPFWWSLGDYVGEATPKFQ